MPFQLRSAGRTSGAKAARSASSRTSNREMSAAMTTSAARAAPSSHLMAMPIETPAGAEPREGVRELFQRQGPGRDRAAVDRAAAIVQGDAGDPFERRLDLALHRMRRIGVTSSIRAHRAGGAEKSGMLAGAIVVERGGISPRPRQRLRGGSMDRRVRA